MLSEELVYSCRFHSLRWGKMYDGVKCLCSESELFLNSLFLNLRSACQISGFVISFLTISCSMPGQHGSWGIISAHQPAEHLNIISPNRVPPCNSLPHLSAWGSQGTMYTLTFMIVKYWNLRSCGDGGVVQKKSTMRKKGFKELFVSPLALSSLSIMFGEMNDFDCLRDQQAK